MTEVSVGEEEGDWNCSRNRLGRCELSFLKRMGGAFGSRMDLVGVASVTEGAMAARGRLTAEHCGRRGEWP